MSIAFLSENMLSVCFGKNEEWAGEREADGFVANLVMPLSQLKDDVREKAFSGDLIQQLADK